MFQYDGAPAHTVKQTQKLLGNNTPKFITKDELPPISPDLSPLDYCVWGLMLAAYQKFTTKPKTKFDLKAVLYRPSG